MDLVGWALTEAANDFAPAGVRENMEIFPAYPGCHISIRLTILVSRSQGYIYSVDACEGYIPVRNKAGMERVHDEISSQGPRPISRLSYKDRPEGVQLHVALAGFSVPISRLRYFPSPTA